MCFESDEVKRAKVPRPTPQPTLLINLEHRPQHSVIQNELSIARSIVVVAIFVVVNGGALYVIPVKGDILANLSCVTHCSVLADGVVGPDVSWSKCLLADDCRSAILVVRSRLVRPILVVVALLRLLRLSCLLLN